jgi:hypothetical protein
MRTILARAGRGAHRFGCRFGAGDTLKECNGAERKDFLVQPEKMLQAESL